MSTQRRASVVIQARMGSSRLPGKVLREIKGKSLLEILINRVRRAKRVDRIIVATTTSKADDAIVSACSKLGIAFWRGSESDVLQRYFDAAQHFGLTDIVRITADCPLTDPDLLDEAIDSYFQGDSEYLCNNYPPSYPDGLDIEVFTMKQLSLAAHKAEDQSDREHVTPYIRKSLVEFTTLGAPRDYSAHRWTVDEKSDFDFVSELLKLADYDFLSPWGRFREIVEANPQVSELNSSISRNEGAILGQGQKLWKRAKTVIPGGNMLLSKRAEMFLPDGWPAYFDEAKGCTVKDLDGRSYIDMSIMGIGTNSLGYGNDEVDNAVQEVVRKGNMSTLNAPEEVYLAERLLQLNPWAQMARFARTGGEANAIAVRIGRAASGRDGVAVCGYHGWHDWYLAANLSSDDSLDGHLLPGLSPVGVPRNLEGSVYTFAYNDFQALKDLVEMKQIGVIKMEVQRNFAPSRDFLQKVRELATANSIVLIFDECTSGFRETFGGLHLKYGVEPDMAMFGKALGNGYAVTAVVGKDSVMQAAQNTFISSTFWTERIGSAAALATLSVMEKVESWKTITALGEYATRGWAALAASHHLNIQVSGLASLASFSFQSSSNLEYKTLITQEMLKKGYLASNSFYASTAHSEEIIDSYLAALDDVFATIGKAENGLIDIIDCLDGPIAHGGFQRLN